MKKFSILAVFSLLQVGLLPAQSLLDVSFGSSQQDNLAFQVAFRKQISSTFRAGVQVQYGMPNYRFISAITFEDMGYSTTVSVPMTFRINDEEGFQLNLVVNPGIRLQGVEQSETNNINGDYRSTAISFEPGLLVNIPSGEKVNFQSGITFPILYEIDPEALFENQTTLLHAGMSYRASDRSIAFIRTNMGSAWGASGDSQKFLWSAQIGIRLVLSKNSNPFNSIIEGSL